MRGGDNLRHFILLLLVAAAGCGTSLAQSQPDAQSEAAAREARVLAALAMDNPLPSRRSPWIEDMTYLEVRDLIRAGHTTAIVATGGIEQNGPYVVTGKHNVALRRFCPEIAARLGNALCAPIVAFVPQGSIDPPTGHMRYPGSFSVRDSTYAALLEDMAGSLRQHGFRHVILIGDSGGNQRGLAAVAEDLGQRWRGSGTSVHYVPEFYHGWHDMVRYGKESLGITETRNDGLHDDAFVTAVMMAIDPASVRHAERSVAGLASINGVDVSDVDRMGALGGQLIDYRVALTVAAIRKAIGQPESAGR